MEARTGGDIRASEVRVARGEHHFVDICFCSPRTTGEDNEAALGDSFVAAETLLGEERLDKWVGAIEVRLAINEQRQSHQLRRTCPTPC